MTATGASLAGHAARLAAQAHRVALCLDVVAKRRSAARSPGCPRQGRLAGGQGGRGCRPYPAHRRPDQWASPFDHAAQDSGRGWVRTNDFCRVNAARHQHAPMRHPASHPAVQVNDPAEPSPCGAACGSSRRGSGRLLARRRSRANMTQIGRGGSGHLIAASVGRSTGADRHWADGLSGLDELCWSISPWDRLERLRPGAGGKPRSEASSSVVCCSSGGCSPRQPGG